MIPPESAPAAAEPLTASNGLERVRLAAPGLIRLAATSSWHLFEWSVRTGVDTGREIMQSLASGNLPIQTVQGIASDLRNVGRQALGLAQDDVVVLHPARPQPTSRSSSELYAKGAELLYRSADVWFTEDVHPAYERILDELASDEVRILRFLAIDGPQPAIDVRTGRPLGIGSELVAGGLSMIGLRSGVRSVERTNAYQNNLFRLGLIWFSREEVDPKRYQVVEVQPDVADAVKRAGRMPKIVRRSIHLTPFGDDFCHVCIPLGDEGFWKDAPGVNDHL